MSEREPLADNQYILEKFPGKGGWTYARIPEIPQDRGAWFGWVKVNGFIDDYELKDYHLMPMGNGQLFLPVRAEIRKKIGKKEGDYVRVKLFRSESVLITPQDIHDCLAEFPEALKTFEALPECDRKYHIDKVQKAKSEDGKIEEIRKLVDRMIEKSGLGQLSK